VGADFDATGANAHIPHSTTRDARDDEKREKPDERADERTREASSTRTEPTRAVKNGGLLRDARNLKGGCER